MIVLYVLGYFHRNKQNSYAALSIFLVLALYYFKIHLKLIE